MEDYGNTQSRRRGTQKDHSPGLAKKGNDRQHEPDNAEDVLMQLEERNVGAVSWDIYKKYLRYAGGLVWAPVIFILLVLVQGSQGWVLLGHPMLSCADPFQLPRHCSLDSGREIPYLASNKLVTWAYTPRLVQISLLWYMLTNTLTNFIRRRGIHSHNKLGFYIRFCVSSN